MMEFCECGNAFCLLLVDDSCIEERVNTKMMYKWKNNGRFEEFKRSEMEAFLMYQNIKVKKK